MISLLVVIVLPWEINDFFIKIYVIAYAPPIIAPDARAINGFNSNNPDKITTAIKRLLHNNK